VADLLPDHAPDFTHVIVTSRPSPQARLLVPPHHPLRRARRVELPRLSVAEVTELLQLVGVETAPAMAARVHEVTRGEPLLARFAAEDIARHGETALVAYQRERPAGVTEYFSWQLGLLDADASDDVTWTALALLLAATGGLADTDLADALGLPAHRIRRSLLPVSRFLIGSDRHELMHEELVRWPGTFTGSADRRQGLVPHSILW
jgi:hypothetical protein